MTGSLPNGLAAQLLNQLQGQPLQHMAQQLDISAEQAGSAVSAALPLVLGALQRGHASGAAAGEAGLGAMGGLGNLLGGLLGGVSGGASGPQTDAGNLLGRIFGGQQAQAQSQLSQSSGLSSGQAGQLLQMLAPLVMGFLAKQAGSGPSSTGGLGNVLGGLLDQNGDGKLDAGDLLQMGSRLLGGGK